MTSTGPGPVVLDWRHARIGPLEPCALCGQPALCRSPDTGEPCHKGCAEKQLTNRTRDSNAGQLVPASRHPQEPPPMTTTAPASLITCALAAAARGWHVFPLRPGGKRPAFPDHDAAHCTGRDPRCRAGHQGWEPRATTDTIRIRRAWARIPYGIGIATGPSGLIVIDLDTPKPGQDTPTPEWRIPGVRTGIDALTVLCERAGQPYPCGTYTVNTGRGGTHLYFTAPAGPGCATPRARTAASAGSSTPARAAGTSLPPGALSTAACTRWRAPRRPRRCPAGWPIGCAPPRCPRKSPWRCPC